MLKILSSQVKSSYQPLSSASVFVTEKLGSFYQRRRSIFNLYLKYSKPTTGHLLFRLQITDKKDQFKDNRLGNYRVEWDNKLEEVVVREH